MDKFVPKDKLGKKTKREMNAQKRVTWAFSPVTKRIDDKKRYNRKRKPRDRYDDGTGLLRIC